MAARHAILRVGLPLGISASLAYHLFHSDSLSTSHVATCANWTAQPTVDTAKPTVYTAAQSYPDFKKHTNILSQYLSSDLYALLQDRQTKNGVTLDHCIQVGVDQPGHPRIKTVGIFAGDQESYQVFADIFDLLITERHSGYKSTDQHATLLDPSLVSFSHRIMNFQR